MQHLPLQAFQTMAKRESIKRAVERKTADFQRLFIDDLNMVKKQFDLLKRVPPADPVLPRYAGQATMALVLAKRVDNTWQALQVCLPACRSLSPAHILPSLVQDQNCIVQSFLHTKLSSHARCHPLSASCEQQPVCCWCAAVLQSSHHDVYRFALEAQCPLIRSA